jgi:hypothetical protein
MLRVFASESRARLPRLRSRPLNGWVISVDFWYGPHPALRAPLSTRKALLERGEERVQVRAYVDTSDQG